MAEMVELVDTRDLKSLGSLELSEFKSRSRHTRNPILIDGVFVSPIILIHPQLYSKAGHA